MISVLVYRGRIYNMKKGTKQYLLQELNFSLVRSMLGWEKQLYFFHTLQRLSKHQHIKKTKRVVGIHPSGHPSQHCKHTPCQVVKYHWIRDHQRSACTVYCFQVVFKTMEFIPVYPLKSKWVEIARRTWQNNKTKFYPTTNHKNFNSKYLLW